MLDNEMILDNKILITLVVRVAVQATWMCEKVQMIGKSDNKKLCGINITQRSHYGEKTAP